MLKHEAMNSSQRCSLQQQDAHGRVREVMPSRDQIPARAFLDVKNYPIQMVTSGFPLRGRVRRQQEGFKLDIISDERLPFVGSAIWKNCGLLPGKLILFHVAWEGEGTSQSFQNSLPMGVEGGEFCQHSFLSLSKRFRLHYLWIFTSTRR